MRRLLRGILDGWKAFARALGRIQTTIILFLVYLLIVGPTSLIVRLLGKDLLNRRLGDEPSFWIPKEAMATDRDAYRRQF